MEKPGPRHTMRLVTFAAGALLLAGCSSAAGLFGGHASDVASNGGTIADAVGALTGPSDSYCRKGPVESSGGATAPSTGGMVAIYKVEAGDCAAGDSAIKEYEYNDIKAKNEALAFQQLHAVAVAEAAKPTYCRTATSHTVYRASAKTCQPGEETISEEEYAAAKAEAAAAATKLP
jgi:hypothetical protein